MSAIQEKELKCVDCGNTFTWTAEEQEFFRDRGYEPPKRCKACRQAKKDKRGDFVEQKGWKQ
jgi:DNA replicative helicase MCM subunit Mcm2 (Cdc46/Mcm family)